MGSGLRRSRRLHRVARAVILRHQVQDQAHDALRLFHNVSDERVQFRGQGLAKDRALLAVTLQIFSEDCAVEVSTHMGLLAAIIALQRSAGTLQDNACGSSTFMTSISVHQGLLARAIFSYLQKRGILWIILQCFTSTWCWVASRWSVLAEFVRVCQKRLSQFKAVDLSDAKWLCNELRKSRTVFN